MEALILALMYTYAQDNRGTKIKFFVVTFDVKWLPWVTLFLTWILAGPQATMEQATGIPAAHLHDFLTRLWPMFGGGRNIIQTPLFISRWFGAGTSGRVSVEKKYGTSMAPATQVPSSASSSGFSGVFSGSWGNRGQGRRLGGG